MNLLTVLFHDFKSPENRIPDISPLSTNLQERCVYSKVFMDYAGTGLVSPPHLVQPHLLTQTFGFDPHSHTLLLSRISEVLVGHGGHISKSFWKQEDPRRNTLKDPPTGSRAKWAAFTTCTSTINMWLIYESLTSAAGMAQQGSRSEFPGHRTGVRNPGSMDCPDLLEPQI